MESYDTSPLGYYHGIQWHDHFIVADKPSKAEANKADEAKATEADEADEAKADEADKAADANMTDEAFEANKAD
jgi:hypothetical protein